MIKKNGNLQGGKEHQEKLQTLTKNWVKRNKGFGQVMGIIPESLLFGHSSKCLESRNHQKWARLITHCHQSSRHNLVLDLGLKIKCGIKERSGSKRS